MERRTLARWLVVAALACFGLLGAAQSATAEQTQQGQNSSTDSSATTGDADGTNSSDFTGGPSASGTDGASSQQNGSNSGSVSQSGSAHSGDPVAGSQVTGAVADDVTVQNQNSADNTDADAGDADVTNEADVTLGPQATTGTGTAQAGQIGDNSVDATQVAEASTGDAVGGSQVTGIVGGGEHTVQNQNTGVDADGDSGDVDVFNDLDVSAGPFAESDDEAMAGQVGDNDAILTQAGEGASGDALAHAQVTGVVGGSATVQTQNTSDNGDAESGEVDLENDIDTVTLATLGPAASSFNSTASSSQSGDNTVDLAQELQGSSGDALSGAQVAGAVGDQGGFLELQSQQASEDDEADSGDVDIENEVDDAIIGPQADGDTGAQAQQTGDNDMASLQTVDAETGDALAGAQVAGAVGLEDVTVQMTNVADNPDAESGEVDDQDDENNVLEAELGPEAGTFIGAASAQQTGNNTGSAGQHVAASTGDALAGAQVTGVVAAGSTVTIQNQNTAVDAEADSGEVDDAQNEIDDFDLGADAFSDDDASASQIGDNDGSIVQSVDAHTGDALAGSQVTGVVAGSDSVVTIQNQNTSDSSDADSGEVDDAENDIDDIDVVGPRAQSFDDGNASASQVGDNTVAIDQSVDASTGDALAGAQVTGVVAGSGSDVTVQNQNSSLDDDADSDEIDDAENSIDIDAFGPLASADDGNASASQVGDNSVAVTQSMTVSTGDAVAGSQVTGVVTGSGSAVTIQNQNTSDNADAESDEIEDAENEIDDIEFVGPNADVDEDGNASATQNGDNTVAIDQSMNASTGDALAGAQVTGVVAGAGSDVTVQNQNTSEDADADSGDVDEALNEIDDIDAIGPQADVDDIGNASASQVGDNTAAVVQSVDASSGDAVAGSQVTGVVSGAGSDVTVQNQNSSLNDDAESGEVEDTENEINDIDQLGPQADTFEGNASAAQTGDNDVAVEQGLGAASGDAVAGSQVTGVVTGSGSDVTVQNQNTAVDSDATSGDVDDDVLNEIDDIDLGPDAETVFGNASATQNGDNTATTSQTIDASSGDAVAGSQVTGVVAGSGSDVTVQNQNTAVDSDADTGDVDVENEVDLDLGPEADSFGEGDASASQIGDNTVGFAQDITAASGDAVAGSQVTGVVGPENATIQVSGTDDGSDADSGDSDATNSAEGEFVRANAFDGTASSVQDGGSSAAGEQTLTAGSGDAVSGSQVNGSVGTSGGAATEVTTLGGGLGAANAA